jgi:hypothetical protein
MSICMLSFKQVPPHGRGAGIRCHWMTILNGPVNMECKCFSSSFPFNFDTLFSFFNS